MLLMVRRQLLCLAPLAIGRAHPKRQLASGPTFQGATSEDQMLWDIRAVLMCKLVR